MVLKKSKTEQVLELLAGDDEVTINEIADKVGCSTSHVSNVRKSYMKQSNANPKQPEDQPDDETVDEDEVNSFIKRVKIKPDADVLTDGDTEENDTETYQCGGCGHSWEANKGEHQDRCPNCGEVFE